MLQNQEHFFSYYYGLYNIENTSIQESVASCYIVLDNHV